MSCQPFFYHFLVNFTMEKVLSSEVEKIEFSREDCNVIWTIDSAKAAALTGEKLQDPLLPDVMMPGVFGIERGRKFTLTGFFVPK